MFHYNEIAYFSSTSEKNTCGQVDRGVIYLQVDNCLQIYHFAGNRNDCNSEI